MPGTEALVLCDPRRRRATGEPVGGRPPRRLSDIRRAIFRKVSPEAVREGTCSTYIIARAPFQALRRCVCLRDINHLPVVDENGGLIDFLPRKDPSSRYGVPIFQR